MNRYCMFGVTAAAAAAKRTRGAGLEERESKIRRAAEGTWWVREVTSFVYMFKLVNLPHLNAKLINKNCESYM